MAGALLRSLLVLGGPAVVPVLALVGGRPVAVLLLLPVGGLLATAAATMSVLVGGGLGPWYAVLALAANLAAVVPLQRRGVPLRASRRDVLLLLVVIGAAGYPLLALRSSAFGYDARSIWWLHARLLTSSGGYVAALHNPAYDFSHPTYPPLLPASVAVAWLLHGESSYRLAQLIVTAFNASAAALLGWTVGQVYGSRRDRSWAALPVAALVVLAAFGIAGGSATNGYADLFTAATTATAVVAGLVLPRGRTALAVAVLCAECAGSTKNEGLVNAALVLALVALRYARADARSAVTPRRWSGLTFPLICAVPLAGWPLAVSLHGGRLMEVTTDAAVPQSTGYRLLTTAAAIAGQLHLLPVVAVLSLVTALLWWPARRRLRLGSSGWLWLSFALGVAALSGIYVAGPVEIRFWLATSVGRTTIYPRLLLICEAATIVRIALSAPLPPARDVAPFAHG